MERFGEKLKILRQRQGLTQQELAPLLDCPSFTYISDLERGRRKPGIELAVKISEFFNVLLDKLAKDYLELDS